MSKAQLLTIHTDGAARGNPGPAAYAYIIQREGARPIEEAGCLGRTTNNQAEYTALIRALEHAVKLGTEHRLLIHSDSELMVKQMRGEYRVKDEGLRPLYERAKELSERFAEVAFRHVRREQNRQADQLCNEALDGLRRPSRSDDEALDSLRGQALLCLRAAAETWAQGNPDEPAPEEIWDMLCKLLEAEGVPLPADSRLRE